MNKIGIHALSWAGSWSDEEARTAIGGSARLGLEVVNRYESNVLNTAAQGVALSKMVGAKNVKVHLDTYNMNIEEADAAHNIDELVKRPGVKGVLNG